MADAGDCYDELRDYAHREGLTGEDFCFLQGLLRQAAAAERSRCLVLVSGAEKVARAGAEEAARTEAIVQLDYRLGKADALAAIGKAILALPESP